MDETDSFDQITDLDKNRNGDGVSLGSKHYALSSKETTDIR